MLHDRDTLREDTHFIPYYDEYPINLFLLYDKGRKEK